MVLCGMFCFAFSQSDNGQSIPANSSLTGTTQFRPGDAVKITVYPDTAAFPNGVYRIDSQGRIDLPILGLIDIQSMTPVELKDTVKNTFINFLPHPNISIRPLIRISLLGGFFRPGLYWIDPRASIWDAVQMAGGIEREDGVGLLRWERSRKLVSSDCVPVFQSGESLSEIGFQSGDQLWVTSRPKRQSWEIFRQEIVPVATTLITTVSSILTLYITYEAFKGR
jgi:polysaccharide export outer membrane protein